MIKIKKAYNLIVIFTFIGVLVCIKPAFGLRPQLLFNPKDTEDYRDKDPRIRSLLAYTGDAKVERTIFIGDYDKYLNLNGEKLRKIITDLKRRGLTDDENLEVGKWASIIERLEEDKIDFLYNWTGLWEGFDCSLLEERAMKILEDSGITDAESVTLYHLSSPDRKEEFFYHKHLKVNICGEKLGTRYFCRSV